MLGVDRITGEPSLDQIGTDGRGRVVLYAGIANYVSSGVRPAVKGQDSDNAITDLVCFPRCGTDSTEIVMKKWVILGL